jgi:hypothetical protein
MREVKISKTSRGFAHIAFKDAYGEQCSLQKSSLATDDAIWLGCDAVERHHVTGELMSPRMHLTRADACRLISALEAFVEFGDLPDTMIDCMHDDHQPPQD